LKLIDASKIKFFFLRPSTLCMKSRLPINSSAPAGEAFKTISTGNFSLKIHRKIHICRKMSAQDEESWLLGAI
jgi:hypothetical protein